MSDHVWETENWFDGLKSFTGLRTAQANASVEMVLSCGDVFLPDNRPRLRDVLLLLWMVTGGGKTITALAYFFAINAHINRKIGHVMRVRRVLWLTNERKLRTQLVHELRDEPVRFGLVARSPRVQACSKPGDIERPDFDITVCCSQALWGHPKSEKTQSEVDIRKERRIRDILSAFDAIVFDECDFASWQTRRLVKLAPHAIKFGLTATPMDANGAIRTGQFLLAGTAAYRDVAQLDKCLRPMLPAQEAVGQKYICAVPHENHTVGDGGHERDVDGKHDDDHSIDGAYRAMIAACRKTSELEDELRRRFPGQWYSPHIIVKCDGISVQRHYKQYLDKWLAANRSTLTGQGWRCCLINGEDGSEGPEFLRAKQLGGRCDDKCARIMFVVDMGNRGLNVWPAQTVVDLSFMHSIASEIQTIGRCLRWPTHLSSLLDAMREDDTIRRLVSPYVFYPEKDSGHPALIAAWNGIVNMHKDIDDAGMVTIADLLDGKSVPDGSFAPPEESPLPLVAKIHAFAGVGRGSRDGAIDPQAIAADICGKVPTASRDRVLEYVDDIRHGRERFGALITPSTARIAVTLREKPKTRKQYTQEDCVRCVMDYPGRFPEVDDIAEFINEIKSGKRIAIALAATVKEDEDRRSYIPAPVVTSLYGRGSIIPDLVRELKPQFDSLQVPENVCYKAVGSAIKMLYGISDLSEKGPMAKSGYHTSLMVRENRRLIRQEALKWVARNNHIADLTDEVDDEDEVA